MGISNNIMTPDMHIIKKIRKALAARSLSIMWLSQKSGIPYSRLQRVLDPNVAQQMTVKDADAMLVALGSSLQNEMAAPIVERFRRDIMAQITLEHLNVLPDL
ncbi:hypothetical protein [Serratia fonticola]|uniref:hypothetical protein n=1 Tax=Serratia fonticola TaxID=47917 RepID=UPI003BB6AA40